VYEDYLSVVLDEPAVIGVLTWGLSDRYTWRRHPDFGGDREDGILARLLLLDAALNRKLSWNAVSIVLSN
jgi:endo-1,4-beta-xylanase